MHGMAFDFSWKIPSGLTHRHEQRLLVQTMEEANEQMFKGELWMAQRLRNGVLLFAGTRWRIHVHGETRFADGDV